MSIARYLPVALLLGSASLGLMPGPAGAQTAHPRYDTCLSVDQNGRPLPNPNASFGCNQIEFQRHDCEKMRGAIPAGAMPSMTYEHCIDFRMEDMRAKPGTAGASTREQQKVGGSSGSGS